MKYILLTFDIEEFDLIKEGQYSISYRGLKKILKLLDKYKIKSTFFTTAAFAQKYPKTIKKISKEHEIALHGLEHKDNYKELPPEESYNKLKKAKQIIEKIINKKIQGFRAPRLTRPSYNILKQLELSYDSSLNPIFLPGYYNNFFKKRKIHQKDNLTILPLSATPIIRLPLSWVFFRNFSLIYSKICTKLCLLDQNNITLIFHPWEFTDLSNLNLPYLIKRKTGKKLLNKLEKYIKWCLNKNMKFDTANNYLRKLYKVI